jgi:hypothetical protein
MRRTSTVTASERHAQHAGDHVLDLAGMLGRGMDEDVVALAGNRQRRLPFEVEVLLPAERGRPPGS